MTNDTFSLFEQQPVSEFCEFSQGKNESQKIDSDPDEDTKLSLLRARELEDRYKEETLPRGFYVSHDNLMYQPDAKGDQDPPDSVFICSRLTITACTRDDANQNHGRLLEFRDVDNVRHEWAMPMQLLAGDGTSYREELLSMGLRIAPGSKARNLLTYFIQSSKPRARVRCVSRTGWHNTCFVLPDQTIGSSGKERVILQAVSSNFPDYAIAGTLADWRDKVSSLCLGNSRLIFSLSVSFASPLLNLLGLENGGFHFRGASSTGKSTALFAAASVWGSKDYVQRWRTTINGIEALAAGYNDALLCLDELSQVDPEKAGQIAYMLSNGSGKTRADRQGYSRKKALWQLLFLSSGEISLAEHMSEAGQKVRAGQEVRIVDIPADTHKYGLFEDLHGHPNGDAFSQALLEGCKAFHGSAAREFLKLLIENFETVIPLIRNFSNEFMSIVVPKNADGQVSRVAKRFALVAAAGELATSFSITGWEKGDAIHSAKACFFDWLNGRGGTGSQEEQAILSQVRRFFEQHGDSRFTPWDADKDHKTINRVGYCKKQDREIAFFVFPESFKTEIAKGFDHKRVAEVCLKHGLLESGSNGELTRSERLPSRTKNTRCYRFTSKVLGDEEASNGS